MRVVLKRDFFGPDAVIYPKSGPFGGWTEVPEGIVLPRDAIVLDVKTKAEPVAVEVTNEAELFDHDAAGHKLAEAVVEKADAAVRKAQTTKKR